MRKAPSTATTPHPLLDPQLTADQRAVVVTPIDRSQLVLAAAGTGKTRVLVERIRRLIHDDELAPGAQLLVLSFTRAVVAELRRRIGVDPVSRRVRPVTFDSFATRLLASAGAEAPTDWRSLGYDRRIAAATRLVEAGVEVGLGEYQHVLVDEIQDLVGVRAEFVMAILGGIDAFTLLGDPAQAIYDHQTVDGETSTEFLQSVRVSHPGAVTHHLETDFRNHTVEAPRVASIGKALRKATHSSDEIESAIVAVYRDLEPLATTEDLATAVRGARRTVGILCRSNSDALRISSLLYEREIDHRLQRDATDRALPSWLAILLRDQTRRNWSESRFANLVSATTANIDSLDPETAWRLLTETAADQEMLDLEDLRRRIGLGLVPDELVAPPPATVIVSTIHRAKGLEFDLVFTTQLPLNDKQPTLEELRVRYVALSRACEELWAFPAPKSEPWIRDPRLDDRLFRTSWRNKGLTTAIEVRPSDLEAARPAGTGIAAAPAPEVQNHLATNVRRGDPIELRLAHVRQTDSATPIYAAVHGGQIVGQTSDRFGEILAARLRHQGHEQAWPALLLGARCDGVETVIGLPGEGQAAEIGSTGFWLRPRLAGTAELERNHEEDG